MKDEMLSDLDKELENKNLTKQQYNSLKDQIISKADQQAKLNEDWRAGKMDEATFEKWYEAISQDLKEIGEHKRQMVEKNIDIRKKKAEKKRRRPFLIGLILIIAIPAGFWLANYIYAHRSIEDVPAPIQVDLSEDERAEKHVVDGKDIGRPDYHLEMRYLASYDIKGLVVDTKHFNDKDVFEKSFPVDVSLAWGKFAANRMAIDCTNGPRKLSCNISREQLKKLKTGREILDLVSNNHLSPANKDIYDKIMRIKAGNYVELKGYLVSIIVTDKDTTKPFTATSSLVRNDHMDSIFDTTNTGCEIFFVTSVDWLD